ncbi:MAG: hypothetical protein AAFV53_00465 [Myxococcota bacterium]
MKSQLLLWTALASLTHLSACDPNVTAYTEEGKIYEGADNSDRLTQAIAGVGAPMLSNEAVEVLQSAMKGTDTAVFIDAPDKVQGLPDAMKSGALFQDPAVREALMGTDEEAAAKLLIEKNARIILLHSDIAATLDRDASVVSRLYNHHHLSYFRLLRVTDGLYAYLVVKQAPSFPPQLAALSFQYLKNRISGRPTPTIPNIQPPLGAWTLVATLRGQGKEMVTALARHPRLQGALNELADDLEVGYRRNIELLGFPPIEQHINDGLTIELHYVYERAYIEPRDDATITRLWEVGIDGAYILRTLDNGGKKKIERGVLPGASAYTRAIREPDRFLRHAADVGHMSEKRPWRAREAWFELFRTQHYRLNADGQVTALYRGATMIPYERVSIAAVRDGIVAAGEWYLSNLKDNGQVTYKVWPSENRYSNEYNFVRHTLATWNLVQAYDLDPRPEFLDGSKRALAFTNAHLKREDVQQACARMAWCESDLLDVEGQMAYYTYNNNQKLGSVVVNMLGMIDLARMTGSHEWDEQLIEMGRFIKFMQLRDGTFRAYYVPENHPYYEQKNDIVPGEAALALVTLADYFDDDFWINRLPAYWTYYKPWFAERAAKSAPDAPAPMHLYTNETRLELVQFGPWTVMAANAYHRRTGDEDVAEFGLDVARWMIESYEWTAENAPFPDYVGGYYKMEGELPAMQAFCYAEGTAAAYQMAERMAPEQSPFFEKATRETMRFALQMQYNQYNTYGFSRPDEHNGGIRYAMNETKVRIDYVYHAQSAMYQWYQAAREDDDLPDFVKNGPPLPGQLLDVPEPEAIEADGEVVSNP